MVLPIFNGASAARARGNTAAAAVAAPTVSAALRLIMFCSPERCMLPCRLVDRRRDIAPLAVGPLRLSGSPLCGGLHGHPRDACTRHRPGMAVRRRDPRAVPSVLGSRDLRGGAEAVLPWTDLEFPVPGEIGRASCRERV